MANSYGLPDYNFQSHFVTLPEGNIHYVDEGSGPIILMLHGNPTWSYLYRHLINSLKGNYRCIALDHLGMGLSDKPADVDYSVAAHIRRLTDFIEALDLDAVTLVVQDWGGPIGLNWAANHKEKVKRLVILNTVAFPVENSQFSLSPKNVLAAGALASLKAPLLGELLVQGLNGFVRLGIPFGTAKKESRTTKKFRGYAYPYPSYQSRKAILQFPREIPLTKSHKNWQLLANLESNLSGWQIPSLIIWGMQDAVMNFSFAEKFASMLPNTKKVVKLENAGHFLQEDCPEEITEEIESFMAKTSEEQLKMAGHL